MSSDTKEAVVAPDDPDPFCSTCKMTLVLPCALFLFIVVLDLVIHTGLPDFKDAAFFAAAPAIVSVNCSFLYSPSLMTSPSFLPPKESALLDSLTNAAAKIGQSVNTRNKGSGVPPNLYCDILIKYLLHELWVAACVK